MSTSDQNLEMQLDALNRAGCKRIFTDKLSGVQVERPGLKEALSHLREADTLVVWKLDRLGRSVKGLVGLVNELDTDGVDAKTPAGRFFFHVMASLAASSFLTFVRRLINTGSTAIFYFIYSHTLT